jgi:D-methionine transport system substrate-binding protein
VVKVPTAPIALYSHKHKDLDEVKEGATVALPNDPTNAARALVVLQQLGWVKLRDGVDPIRASEKDVAVNIKKIKLVPLEAAQLPRSLDDTDYSFVNGNFALASGLKMTEALALEKTGRPTRTWSRPHRSTRTSLGSRISPTPTARASSWPSPKRSSRAS